MPFDIDIKRKYDDLLGELEVALIELEYVIADVRNDLLENPAAVELQQSRLKMAGCALQGALSALVVDKVSYVWGHAPAIH